jgi:hypothetical protein
MPNFDHESIALWTVLFLHMLVGILGLAVIEGKFRQKRHRIRIEDLEAQINEWRRDRALANDDLIRAQVASGAPSPAIRADSSQP